MPPWINPWLLIAEAVSFGLHFLILYVPFLADIFGIVPLSFQEWLLVIIFSLPVILIDEVPLTLQPTINFPSATISVATACKYRDVPACFEYIVNKIIRSYWDMCSPLNTPSSYISMPSNSTCNLQVLKFFGRKFVHPAGHSKARAAAEDKRKRV